MLVLSSNQASVSSILVAYWLTLSPSLVMAFRTLLPDKVEVLLAFGSSASSSKNSLEKVTVSQCRVNSSSCPPEVRVHPQVGVTGCTVEVSLQSCSPLLNKF